MSNPEDVGGQADPQPPEQQQQPYVFEFERNGEKVSIADRAEQQRLAQMGYDYTQKTQALAKEKAEFQARVLEEARKMFEQAGGQQTQGQEVEDDPTSVMSRKIAELESKLHGFETAGDEARADQEFGSMVSKMRETHKELSDRDEQLIVLKFSQNANDAADPHALLDQYARELLKEKEQMKQQYIDEYVKAKSKNPFSSGETGRGSAGAVDNSKPPSSMEEAKKRAFERLRALDGM